MAGRFGFGENESQGTQRSGTKVEFPKQFLLDYHNLLGGPFTTGDLFRLAPRQTSLFGGEPEGPFRQGGGFNLGFGLPPAGAGVGLGGGTEPPPGAPQQKKSQIYGINDILPAWDNDPEKVMDLNRFFRQSGLNPDGFTREEFAGALPNLKKWGFSGRSRGNFDKALALLRSDDQLGDAFGGPGGRGSGIF